MVMTNAVRSLEKQFSSSMFRHIPQGETVMLGYSGGPDSEALFHLCQTVIEHYPLHLVHIDHGWRSESKAEALVLQEKAKGFKIPFHMTELNPSEATGNLENWSRIQRYRFFEEVGEKIGACWLLLGHHKDDSLEVVLRRLMEGSHLIHASGIAACSMNKSLHVFRPLLHVGKEELLAYLQAKGVDWIVDYTNEDVRFQRAAMRRVIIPSLSCMFEKNIRKSLGRLSYEATLLGEHVDKELFDQFLWKETETVLFCQKKRHEQVSRFLYMQALHKATSFMSREQEIQAVEILSGHSPSASFLTKHVSLYVDKESFILFRSQNLPSMPKHVLIENEGVFHVGAWEITVTNQSMTKLPSHDPFDLFQHGFVFPLSQLPFEVVTSTEKAARSCSSIKQNRLPASFRKQTPLFLHKNKPIAAPCLGWTKKGSTGHFTISVRLF